MIHFYPKLLLMWSDVLDPLHHFGILFLQENARQKGRMLPRLPESHGNVLGGLVLMVKVGQTAVSNLSERIQLVFKKNHLVSFVDTWMDE